MFELKTVLPWPCTSVTMALGSSMSEMFRESSYSELFSRAGWAERFASFDSVPGIISLSLDGLVGLLSTLPRKSTEGKELSLDGLLGVITGLLSSTLL